MSSYVIFHLNLFERLERLNKNYSSANALEETLEEVLKIFPVYARSGLADYREVWDVKATSAPAGAQERGGSGS